MISAECSMHCGTGTEKCSRYITGEPPIWLLMDFWIILSQGSCHVEFKDPVLRLIRLLPSRIYIGCSPQNVLSERQQLLHSMVLGTRLLPDQ